MKKILSIVLSITMLLSITAGLNLQAFADTAIKSLWIKNAEQEISYGEVNPLIARPPCFDFVITANSGISDAVFVDTSVEGRGVIGENIFYNGVAWRDLENGQALSAENEFEIGHRYSVTMILKCSDGYTFKKDETNFCEANIRTSGIRTQTEITDFWKDCNVEEYTENRIVVSYEFSAVPTDTDIDKFSISMNAPQADGSPIDKATVYVGDVLIDKTEDNAYINNTVKWVCLTDDNYTLNSNDTFEKGKTYRAYVRVRARDGYQFKTEDGNYTVEAKLGGETASIIATEGKNSAKYITLYIDYTITETVYDLEMSVDMEYLSGKAPVFFPNSEEPDKYIAYRDLNTNGFENGVRYYDKTNGVYLETGSTTFVTGHSYQVTVAVKCNDGYQFAGLNKIKGSIDGFDGVVDSKYTYNGSDFRIDKVWFITADLINCQKDINDCRTVISSRTTYVYDGRAQKLVVSIYDGDDKLKEGRDYEVLYMGNRTNAGKVTYEIAGMGNYCGTLPMGTFTIKKKSITPKVNLSFKKAVYNSSAKKPTVSVYDGTKKLATSQYTVAYSNSKSKYVGEYSVKVTLKGNYSGSKSVTYTIIPKGTALSKTASKGKDWISVQWTKQATQTTGYEIMYSKSAGFKSGNKTADIPKNTQTTKKFTGLKKNTKYYFKIRTYKTVKVNGRKKKIYSSWSAVKQFNTRK